MLIVVVVGNRHNHYWFLHDLFEVIQRQCSSLKNNLTIVIKTLQNVIIRQLFDALIAL